MVAALIVVGSITIGVTGFSARFESRGELNAIRSASGIGIEESGGAVLALHHTLPSALAITVTLLAICRLQYFWMGPRNIRLGDIALLCVGVSGVVLFANPISQSRFIALTAIGSVLIMLLRPRSPRAGIVYIISALIMTLVIYPLGNVYRYQDSQLEDVTFSTFTSADFDGFQQIINTLSYVEQRGYSFGSEMLSALLFFVPRSAWSTKAPPASHEVAEFAGYSYTNLSLPLHAEFFMQFGILGVALGMAALGFVGARFDNAWLSAPFGKAALLTPLIAVGMIGLLRGPLLGQVPAFLPAVVFLAICIQSSGDEALAGSTFLKSPSQKVLSKQVERAVGQ
ncbi:hypothetical protein QYF68_21280 [Mycolicibacterium austroafricanum]|uniref:Polymerase n=1 Tax=Mycolicibacterium austroafricanum TaxID=39687 RepID=A0ABT8HHV2_MYCAO|nr:hypothetical protein [Mycolicibacterium austroafricanum]MDN4520334.1 hypothetical protein [Mycolicibacterium austroafricanum]